MFEPSNGLKAIGNNYDIIIMNIYYIIYYHYIIINARLKSTRINASSGNNSYKQEQCSRIHEEMGVCAAYSFITKYLN